MSIVVLNCYRGLHCYASEMSNSEIFSRIYRNREWNGDGLATSLSGPGSTVSASKFYVDQVLSFIKEKDITTVVDVGHGDWLMWPSDCFKNISYTGFDVADEISEICTDKFGTENIKFINKDATLIKLPHSELILIKDVLGHLTVEDIQLILSKASKFRYVIICEGFKKIQPHDWPIIIRRILQLRRRVKLMMTRENPFRWFPIFDFHIASNNKNIVTGEHRTIDLRKSPFDLDKSGLKMIRYIDYPGHDFRIVATVKRIWFLEGKL